MCNLLSFLLKITEMSSAVKQHVLTGKALKLSYNCVRQTHFREDNGNKKKIMTGIKKKNYFRASGNVMK